MHFVKMHGIGNDYVYLDAYSDLALAERDDLPELARKMSDRHTGIGSDGLILVCRPSAGVDADVRMRMFNADGSESEMCGNGIRCVAKFAHDRLDVRKKPMRVETGRGVLSIDYEVEGTRLTRATVDMGEPIVNLPDIPVDTSELSGGVQGLEYEVGAWEASFVSMGNPHCVAFVEDLNRIDLRHEGALLENHPAFPRRVNAHFVQVSSEDEATMATWERGSGITMACGTGACAVLVAGVRTRRLERTALLHLPGGDLNIHWDESTNHVFMTGPATDVFEGDWPD